MNACSFCGLEAQTRKVPVTQVSGSTGKPIQTRLEICQECEAKGLHQA